MDNESNNIDVDKIKKHWINSSEEDYKTMIELFNSKKYNWALFLGHISLEKLLKGIYVGIHRQHAPFTHNLYRLAESCHIDLNNEYADWLDMITSFNLNARYNDYKKEFYKKCTQKFTESWIEKIKTLQIWLKKML